MTSNIQVTEHFMHTPLDATSKQIRLFKLHHRYDAAEQLRGTIKTVDLKTKPIFKALSYTWGNELLKFDLSVNGKTQHSKEPPSVPRVEMYRHNVLRRYVDFH
jgi:hypothetical protein